MSLFNGVRERVAGELNLRSLNHRADVRAHRFSPLTASQGRQVAESVFSVVRSNAEAHLASRAISGKPRSPSGENWRMTSPGTHCDEANHDREVGLERAIVRAFHEVGNMNWWNQVPVASGLFGATAGKRRAIDLVRRRDAATFDFIELKLNSNTPLFAAVELLEYGCAWYFSRMNLTEFGYSSASVEASLLGASRIHLSVLAPDAFYCGATYEEFGCGIAAALDSLAERGELSFEGFKRMPLEWNREVEPTRLRTEVSSLYGEPSSV